MLPYEYGILANLMPEQPEEAMALLPSLRVSEAACGAVLPVAWRAHLPVPRASLHCAVLCDLVTS